MIYKYWLPPDWLEGFGSSWNCPSCGTNNAARWLLCDFCFKPKPQK